MTSIYDSTGYTGDRYADILARLVELAEAWKGESLSTDEQELLGHLFRQEALLVAEDNEIIQALYDALGVSNNSGVPLDNILEVIGIYRSTEAPSTATVTCTVDRALTIPAGKIVKTAAEIRWTTDVDLVFAAAGSANVAVTCTVNGPNNAGVGEINAIVTPIDGWLSVTNAAAAVPGRNRQTDAELKTDHTNAVSTSGDRDAASIYEAVAAVDGVSAVSVVEDYESVTPVAVYVIGGADADIAAAIDQTITIGIGLAGSTSVVVYNTTTRDNKTIKFTRATNLSVYIDMVLTVNPALYPTDGADQIKAAIVALFDGQGIGEDVIYMTLPAAILTVPGVVINQLYVGTAPSPSGTSDVAVPASQRAVIDSADIGITAS